MPIEKSEFGPRFAMPRADDLLDVAHRLRESSGGSEAARRRAISDAYYAAFGEIIEGVASLITHDGAAARISRRVNHSHVKAVANAIISAPPAGSPLASRTKYAETIKHTVLPDTPSSDLRTVGEAFVASHRAREAADYDYSRTVGPGELHLALQSATDIVRLVRSGLNVEERSSLLYSVLLQAIPKRD